jgi:hypothetical protein
MTGLILKRASLSRPSGNGSDDDYDVLEDGGVGRGAPQAAQARSSNAGNA